MTKPLLLRVDRVAMLLDYSVRQIYDLIRSGELESHNPNPGHKGMRVTTESLEKYAAKHLIPVDFYRE